MREAIQVASSSVTVKLPNAFKPPGEEESVELA